MQRPKTRGQCAKGGTHHFPDACPWSPSCKWGTAVEALPNGMLYSPIAGKLTKGSVKAERWMARVADTLEDLPHRGCALDAADEDGMTLDQIGKILNLTRERARQIVESSTILLRKRMLKDEV